MTILQHAVIVFTVRARAHKSTEWMNELFVTYDLPFALLHVPNVTSPPPNSSVQYRSSYFSIIVPCPLPTGGLAGTTANRTTNELSIKRRTRDILLTWWMNDSTRDVYNSLSSMACDNSLQGLATPPHGHSSSQASSLGSNTHLLTHTHIQRERESSE